jgi:hypothetical protein
MKLPALEWDEGEELKFLYRAMGSSRSALKRIPCELENDDRNR